MNIYFDCETTSSGLQWVKDEIVVEPPGNYKKPESIQAWMETHGETMRHLALAKTALDTSLAEIICIGFAVDDGEIQTLTGPEDEILAAFHLSLSGYRNIALVGHNIIGFDIPLVFHRFIVNKIRPVSPFHMHHAPWKTDVFDTMTEWAGTRDRIKLDKLCKILGIEGKGDIDGSMVPRLYAAKEIDKIAEYCAEDVERVRQIYKRITGNV